MCSVHPDRSLQAGHSLLTSVTGTSNERIHLLITMLEIYSAKGKMKGEKTNILLRTYYVINSLLPQILCLFSPGTMTSLIPLSLTSTDKYAHLSHLTPTPV